MSGTVYRVTEVIGTSAESWEAAAQNAVATAGHTIRDLRVAEATRFDVTIKDGKIADYLVRIKAPAGSFYRSVQSPGPAKRAQDRRIAREYKNEAAIAELSAGTK